MFSGDRRTGQEGRQSVGPTPALPAPGNLEEIPTSGRVTQHLFFAYGTGQHHSKNTFIIMCLRKGTGEVERNHTQSLINKTCKWPWLVTVQRWRWKPTKKLSSLMWALPTVTEENCLKSGFLPPNESTCYCEINSSLMSSFVVPAAESVWQFSGKLHLQLSAKRIWNGAKPWWDPGPPFISVLTAVIFSIDTLS